MEIVFENETEIEIGEELYGLLNKVIALTMEFEEFGDDYEVNVSFVDKDEIKRINQEFRGIDSVTDVLSFPQYDENGEFYAVEDENYWIGDVVLCMDKAHEQAIEYGHSFEREICYLTCHSILHLLGYDHEIEEDKLFMRSREKLIMDKFYKDEGL